MNDVMPVTRRLMLRRLAGGGAVFCTLFTELGQRPALGASHAGRTGPPPLILLDPGHGGRDPGATGAAGTLEKDVTLASAQALKLSLEASGLYRVGLTRGKDRFIPLENRADIARERGAALFLSLHADTVSDPTVRGASVYTLARRASDPETEALAQRENGTAAAPRAGVDYVSPEVSGILASLASREVRAASARMAHQVVRDLERDLPVLPSPERHAHFTVLQAAGIPSVLIEMGFLSNPADEAALNDPGHRDLIALSVTRAVDAWFAGPRPGHPT